MMEPNECVQYTGKMFDSLDADDIIFRLSAKATVDFLRYVKEHQGYGEICKEKKNVMMPLLNLVNSLKDVAKDYNLSHRGLFQRIDTELSKDFDSNAKVYLYIMLNCDSIVRTAESMMIEFNINIIDVVYSAITSIAKNICEITEVSLI